MENALQPKRSVTVADVARAANVSKATAARVLGGYGIVSDKIREQVLATAKALSYRPNELARSMTTGKSGILGVVVGDIENAYFSLAVRGISDAARIAGLNVILANSGEELELEKSAIRVLIGKRVDGLIVTPAQSADIDHLREIRRAGIPLVLFDRAIPSLEVDAVTGNDRDAAILATRRLIEAGHRRIAYITATDPPDHGQFNLDQVYISAVRERVEGFLDVLRAAGHSQPEQHVRLGATGPTNTRRILADLLAGVDRPTAIIASDSLVGLDVFKAIRDLGLSIPEDISLISFLDADWTSVTTPPVTVIDQPVYELGKAAAERLIRRLNGDRSPPQRAIIPTSLIERGSIGSPSRD